MSLNSKNSGSLNVGAIVAMSSCYALGTFTDNFYKQAAILMAASMQMTDMQSRATVLFSLPFILFSAWGGAMADRVAKKNIAITIKAAELLTLLFGGYMLCMENWTGILIVVFLMGIQTTFFSPAINGAIPETFPTERVPRANSLIKLSSTTAVLVGFTLAGFMLDIRETSLGGILPDLGLRGAAFGRAMASIFVIIVSTVGLATAFTVRYHPRAAAKSPPFPWGGPIASAKQAWECRKDKALFLAILCDSWFYGIAAIAVISVANLAKGLSYSDSMAGAMMALLMIGVAAGGLMGGRFTVASWSRRLLPMGSGMAFMLLLVAATQYIPTIAHLRTIWFGITLLSVGFFGGMYIIPVKSFIQVRPAASEKGKILGISNYVRFIAMALFGAAFKGISLLPPAWTFAVYGGLTLCFLYGLVRHQLRILGYGE